MEYREDEFLMLSGLQHFSFCRRQWSLIHVEQLWAENLRTVEGNLLHRKAHDSADRESRGDLYILRGMSVMSRELGISGQCDVIEFRRDGAGISLNGKEGLWQPYPVEYKRGSPKENDADRIQLCAQAMCLEEMLSCSVDVGYLFYGEIRRREEVRFSSELRDTVRRFVTEMHDYFKRGHTPRVKPGRWCNACSLSELCLPKMLKQRNVREYLEQVQIEENATDCGALSEGSESE
ncbi:MAG: CRISPR-associated protein Cas4 [Clostridia bacterium]|nr:CRISPR-associated protein Cas4 [Clostridia bacterium]